jgi:hypothetical protein
MKIFGVNVPLPMVDLYNKYVTTMKRYTPTDWQVQRSRVTGTERASRSGRKIEEEITWAATWIATKLKIPEKTRWRGNFIDEEQTRIASGIFDPRYWQACQKQSVQYLQSTGTNTEDINPPPYGYRRADMRPSDVIYSSGAPNIAPLRCSGGVTAGRWFDELWTWRKTTFELPTPITPETDRPVVWWSKGVVKAQATTRGSRPMFSQYMRAHIVGASSPYDLDNKPPVQPATSLYWRYQIPRGAAPYYYCEKNRQLAVILNKRSTRDSGQNLTRVIVKSSVRPMLGHGYNNNLFVETRYEDDEQLYEVYGNKAEQFRVTNVPSHDDNWHDFSSRSPQGWNIVGRMRGYSKTTLPAPGQELREYETDLRFFIFGYEITLIRESATMLTITTGNSSFTTCTRTGFEVCGVGFPHLNFIELPDRLEWQTWEFDGSVQPMSDLRLYKRYQNTQLIGGGYKKELIRLEYRPQLDGNIGYWTTVISNLG